MHSFISHSDRAVPDGPWGLTLLVAVLITIAFLGEIEVFVRSQGYLPTVPDTQELWSYHRNRVYDKNGKSVVLLGESRMQTGFSPRVFRNRYSDYELTQLAISGTSPLATLEDLARDEKFIGIIICSMAAVALHEGVEQAHSQSEYVANSQRAHEVVWTVAERLKLQYINSLLAVTRPQFRLRLLLQQLVMGSASPDPEFLTTQFDRSQRLRFQNVDIDEQRANRVGAIREFFDRFVSETPDQAKWFAAAERIKPFIDKIRDRGGEVVFVRFPETGEHWELSNAHFPKDMYWDHLSELTGARTIHFKDVPSLANFDCPDTSHLDVRDIDAFTNALLDECVRQGLFSKQE